MIRTPLIATLAIAAFLVGGTPRAAAADSFLEGVDVSHWQRRPRWADVQSAGIDFVIVRASIASAGQDSEYARNRTRLRKRGIPFTAYHHAKPDAAVGDALAEADNFVNVARLSDQNLVPVLELKSHGTMSVEMLTEWAKTWLTRVEERLGVKAMIYASAPFWADWLGDTTWFADNGYRLWIRDWYVDNPAVPADNWGGHSWTIWQYGKAAVPGIRSKVDVNHFNGTDLAPLRIYNNR